MKKVKMTESEILNLIEEVCQQKPGGRNTESSQELDEEEIERLLEPYQKEYYESQIREIRFGLEQELPVEVFAKQCYNWMQMRELRLGLYAGVDVSVYATPLFTAAQMREIRWGLMDHLPVQEFAKLIYSPEDMKEYRAKLLRKAYRKKAKGYEKILLDDDTGIQIHISDDYLSAFLLIPTSVKRQFMEGELKALLRKYDICEKYLVEDTIRGLAGGNYRGKEVLVAEGNTPQRGRNGSHEFLFEKRLPGVPEITGDGRADYTNVMVAEAVEKDQKLVKYHPAKKGRSGRTVTGVEIPGEAGKELRALSGKGFYRSPKDGHYYAAIDGHVSFEEKKGFLNVVEVLLIQGDLTRINGNIDYEGTVHVQGNVNEMTRIRAGKDIIVDGYVEGAKLYAGNNIMIRKGANAANQGYIEAGGKIMGSFFESVVIKAKGSIEGNYFMNCKVDSDGKIEARGGKSRIIGGKLCAVAGIETTVLGSPSRNRTEVEVGNTMAVELEYSQCKKRMEQTETELMQLREAQATFVELAKVDEEKEKLLHKIIQVIGMKEVALVEEKAELSQLEAKRKRSQNAYVRVRGSVFENVLITIGGLSKEIQEDTRATIYTREKIMGGKQGRR